MAAVRAKYLPKEPSLGAFCIYHSTEVRLGERGVAKTPAIASHDVLAQVSGKRQCPGRRTAGLREQVPCMSPGVPSVLTCAQVSAATRRPTRRWPSAI